MLRLLACIVVFVCTLPAYAQVRDPAQPGDLAVIYAGPLPGSHGGSCLGTLCLSPTIGIPMSYFATAGSVAVLQAEIARAGEMAVVAAAIRSAVPEPGKTFALNFNAAAGGSHVAGSVGFGARLGDHAVINLNYSQGSTTGIASGGVTFSW